MLVFEVLQDDKELIEEILQVFSVETTNEIDSLAGDDIIQILVPLTSIVAPLAAQVLQKFFDDNRVTIKYDGIEVYALGYEKAMKNGSILTNRDGGRGSAHPEFGKGMGKKQISRPPGGGAGDFRVSQITRPRSRSWGRCPRKRRSRCRRRRRFPCGRCP